MIESEWLTSDDPVAMLTYYQSRFVGPNAEMNRKLRLFACACCRQVWHLLTDDAPCGRCLRVGTLWALRAGEDVQEPCPVCSGTGRVNRSRRAVEVAERFADGEAYETELRVAFDAAHQAAYQAAYDANAGYFTPAWLGFYVSDNRPEYVQQSLRNVLFANTSVQVGQSPTTQAALLREIVGNPFRPVTLPLVRACWKCGRFAATTDKGANAALCECGIWHDGKGYCPWLTPTVLSLAQAAYDERPGRECDHCGGLGTVGHDPAEWAPEYGIPPPEERATPCPDCHGTGRIEDGALDPVRLMVLADALEEAGIGDVSCQCNTPTVQAVRDAGAFWSCVFCGGTGRVPHPVLAHLRSPGITHVRGCWALDLILDMDLAAVLGCRKEGV